MQPRAPSSSGLSRGRGGPAGPVGRAGQSLLPLSHGLTLRIPARAPHCPLRRADPPPGTPGSPRLGLPASVPLPEAPPPGASPALRLLCSAFRTQLRSHLLRGLSQAPLCSPEVHGLSLGGHSVPCLLKPYTRGLIFLPSPSLCLFQGALPTAAAQASFLILPPPPATPPPPTTLLSPPAPGLWDVWD